MTDQDILNEIVAFCKHKSLESTRNNHILKPKESDLHCWIQTSCSLILESVIPSNFWEENLMPEPGKLDRFYIPPKKAEDCVLMLSLWSSWSHECSQHIVQCLESGANIWKSYPLEGVC